MVLNHHGVQMAEAIEMGERSLGSATVQGISLICGDSFWLLQKIVKSESLQDMLSKISA